MRGRERARAARFEVATPGRLGGQVDAAVTEGREVAGRTRQIGGTKRLIVHDVEQGQRGEREGGLEVEAARTTALRGDLAGGAPDGVAGHPPLYDRVGQPGLGRKTDATQVL